MGISRFMTVALVAAGFLLAAADNADAWRKSGGGRSSSSSARSKQPVTGYIMKRCKTDACEKKHPSGRYSIPMHKKKKG